MAAVSLAILGKNNEPLYIKEFFDGRNDKDARIAEEELFGLPLPQESDRTKPSDCSLHHQFILHAALDRFEQLSGPPPGYGWRKQGLTGADAMFVGLLCPVEDLRVYGYMTTTQIRFIMTVEDRPTSVGDQRAVDEAIKQLFVKIHQIFVEFILNPFCTLNAPIRSKHFEQKVHGCIETFNQAVGYN